MYKYYGYKLLILSIRLLKMRQHNYMVKYRWNFSQNNYAWQRAKKVLSDSPGLVDFAIGLVSSVFNLPDGQVMFYEEFE